MAAAVKQGSPADMKVKSRTFSCTILTLKERCVLLLDVALAVAAGAGTATAVWLVVLELWCARMSLRQVGFRVTGCATPSGKPPLRVALRRAARLNHVRGFRAGCVEAWGMLAGAPALAVVQWARLCATCAEPVHSPLGSFPHCA